MAPRGANTPRQGAGKGAPITAAAKQEAKGAAGAKAGGKHGHSRVPGAGSAKPSAGHSDVPLSVASGLKRQRQAVMDAAASEAASSAAVASVIASSSAVSAKAERANPKNNKNNTKSFPKAILEKRVAALDFNLLPHPGHRVPAISLHAFQGGRFSGGREREAEQSPTHHVRHPTPYTLHPTLHTPHLHTAPQRPTPTAHHHGKLKHTRVCSGRLRCRVCDGSARWLAGCFAAAPLSSGWPHLYPG